MANTIVKAKKFTEEDIQNLTNYFDVTEINITSLIKKIGSKKVTAFLDTINKLYGKNGS